MNRSVSNAAAYRDGDDGKVAAKALRVLILGGTGFIGPHFVRAAVERGHQVAVFNRGKSAADLPETVDRLVGDRAHDLESIQDRDWDAVVDLATFVPQRVRTLGERLRGRVGHYTFISTVAVYDRPRADEQLSENSRLRTYDGSADPYTLSGPKGAHEYGALKALCEREAEQQFPKRTLVLRPGYIAGPGDPQPYLGYWAMRMHKGGEILAAGDPSLRIQFIDARDLADWALYLIETSATGIFNTVGPTSSGNLGELTQAALAAAPSSSKVTWVSSPWLAGQKNAEIWGMPLFWSSESEWAWSMQMNIGRALAAGLTVRPMSATLADTFAWEQDDLAHRQAQVVVWKRKEDKTLEKVTMPWGEYLDHEKEVLAAWNARQGSAPTSRASVNADGTVHVPTHAVPLSPYMSDGARRAYIDMMLNPPKMPVMKDMAARREATDRVVLMPKLERAQSAYAVTVEAKRIGDIRTQVVLPKEGVAKENQERVLISLHGGGFMLGSGALQLIEAIPVAATAKIKVISVEYRLAPEHRFPAASEDVATVYRELLKDYAPENIGIYGSSAGGTLTAMAMAWFQREGLPRPGAIAILTSGCPIAGGDLCYTAPTLLARPAPPAGPNLPMPMAAEYFAGTDVRDPLVSPMLYPEVLAHFPPALLITGTRDVLGSYVIYMHRQLVKAGVDAQLHVWDGMWYGFFWDVSIPESQDVYSTMAKFFGVLGGRR